MVSRWNYNSPKQERDDHSRLARQVRIQAPELIAEWTAVVPSEKQKAMDHLRSFGVPVPDDAGIVSIGKHTIKNLNIFAHKATLCLYFERFKAPLPNNGAISAHWRTKENFANGGVPKRLLEILPEYATITQGKWDESETFEYRQAANEADGLFGMIARLRTGLYVSGFAVRDMAKVRDEFEGEWIPPNQLLSEHDHFSKKN